MQNPTLEYAESIEIPKGTEEIISQGGGSTIDVGKWLANKYKLKHTAIPTTAGTGSEITRYCVLTVKGKKKTYELKKPDKFILDPSLVVSLPRLYTISSGLDALAQSFESLWSKNATEESKKFSQVAINLIMEGLPLSLEDPEDETAREAMLMAAHLSGKAIEITKTNVCHAISYPLTDIFNIPHGIACALSLKYFCKKFLDIDLTDFLDFFKDYKYNINRQTVAEIASKSKKLKDCPLEVSKDDILESIKDACIYTNDSKYPNGRTH